MGKKSTGIKTTDGRLHNKRKAGHQNVVKRASNVNKAKKSRQKELGLKAIKKTFGSELDLWMTLAEEAKSSHNDRKLLIEYVYGKAGASGGLTQPQRGNAPTINFITNEAPKQDDSDIIDVTPEE